VVSIYINPTQFGPREDLSSYPRDLPRDKKLCKEAGTDVLFVPPDSQMYPGRETGRFSTYVLEESLSQGMEGASRPTHFKGVATVVAKLFNIIQPSVAVFGAKDFQQAAVVKRMVQDLNFPVKILVSKTIREPDGLALSSRNKYLTPEQRPQATVLWRSIQQVRKLVRQRPVPAGKLRAAVQKLIDSEPAARLDYVEFFDPNTWRPVTSVEPGTHMAIAVFVGSTRLIDNSQL
jgi:pantoate--beta-alanine ligase